MLNRNTDIAGGAPPAAMTGTPAPGRARGRLPVAALVALACWAAALGALLLIFQAGHPVQGHLVHSDALYLPVLFDDVLTRGGSLSDWYLTPAPYFFPDMLVYLPAWLGGNSAFQQTLLFALLQAVLASGALYFLARQALPRERMPAAALLAIVFVWLGLHADDPFVRLFSSAHHYGAFIVALVLAALWLGRDAGRGALTGKAGAAALAALGLLTTLSDALFLVQAVLPLLAAALLYRHDAPQASSPRRALLLLFLPALLGMLSYKLVVAHPTRYSSRLGLSRLTDNLAELGKIGATLFGERPLLAATVALVLALGMVCIGAALRKRPLPGLTRPLQLLAAFATLSCAATLAVMLLSTTVLPVARYLISALSLPLIAGVFALAHLLGQHFRYPGVALCLVFTGLLAADAWKARAQDDSASYYYTERIACVDRVLAAAAARHGIAQYWDAKHLQGLSRSQLTLAQYTPELEPMKWITSERFFRPAYDFAIIANGAAGEFRLPVARLIAFNGEPAQTAQCGDLTVLVYATGTLRVPAAAPGK